MLKALIALSIIVTLGMQSLVASPASLTTYFKPNGEYVQAEFGTVRPPAAINPYLAKLRHAANTDPEWFQNYSKSIKADQPMPYHEKLGITKEEYEEYLALWKQRTFKELKRVDLRLEKKKDDTWMIRATGPGFPIQALTFSPDFQTIISPNGTLKRTTDISSNQNALLGAWTGAEWMLESKGSISDTRENFAIGKQANNTAGYLLYRIQEVSSTGRVLYDNQILLQFPLKK